MSDCKGKRVGEGSSTCRFKSICVLGGKVSGKDERFIIAAKDLGQAMATRGIELVYGGGSRGLRGCVAMIALVWGSRVLGVSLKEPNDKTIDDFAVGSELKVSNLPERLKYMFFNAEAFIALPGDLETLSEISNIVSWFDMNLHKKPLILLNINGFYDNLLSFLDQTMEQGFVSQMTRRSIMSASTVDQVFNHLQTYATEPDLLMKQADQQPPDNNKSTT